MPPQDTGTPISVENWAAIEPSIGVVEQPGAAPSRAGMMRLPIGLIVVDSDTPPSLGR